MPTKRELEERNASLEEALEEVRGLIEEALGPDEDEDDESENQRRTLAP